MSLEKLIKGFQTFRTSYFEENDHYKDLVTKGQGPETMVIACSDSRNDPAHLMQSKPGEIFVVRNVAAIVPPYQPDKNYHGTSAAIEFAVRGLKVKNIVVLGHGLCGGIQALAGEAKTDDFEFLSHWITIGRRAKEVVDKFLGKTEKQIRLRALEQAMILTSLNNLMSFPWIKEGTESGSITLYGWYFDMMNGKLLGYDFAEGCFKEMEKPDSEDLKFSGSCCSGGWPLETLIKSHI